MIGKSRLWVARRRSTFQKRSITCNCGLELGKRPSRTRRTSWHGQWRDAKGFRFSLIDDERIVPLLSWPQVQNDEPLGEALKQITEAGMIPEEQVRLWVICESLSE